MTVALVAIVRDEASRLPRLFSSVAGLVDRAVIVDTGSLDDTADVIDRWDIPVVLHHRPWHDFGTNRTEALGFARGAADWLLELDADQTVTWHPDLPGWLHSDQADAEAYMITETEAGTTWRRPRLTRGNLDWTYLGATHEYLNVDGRHVRDLHTDSLTITHHADGAHRADKFHRDIALLADGVTAGDPRAIFYTAECHRYLGQLEAALDLYDRRAMLAGWEEEAWYAEYQAGRCALELGHPTAIARLLAAHARRPGRAEPLATIAAWCNTNKAAVPPVGDRLFIDTTAY